MTDEEIIDVGICEFKVAFGNCVLRAAGIGSCLVIILYDWKKKIGALSHCMLPEAKKNHPSPKYVDWAIRFMTKEMMLQGADLQNFEAKIVGGANLLEKSEEGADIGRKNVNAAIKELTKMGVPITVKEVGLNFGRNAEFHIFSGELLVNNRIINSVSRYL